MALTFLAFVLVVNFPVLNAQGLCKVNLSLTECCSGGSCCIPSDNGFQQCCCDETCFQYNDCCLDIYEIGCITPSDVSPINLCTLYRDFYTCSSAGITDGCCTGNNCTVSNSLGEVCCSCAADCHVGHNCCPDIDEIGCGCENKCGAHQFSGCCESDRVNCHTPCEDYCFCDEVCHSRGDCCSDILTIGCRNPATPIACNEEILNGIEWPETPVNSFHNISCPSGKTGIYLRYCNPEGKWNPVNNTCQSADLKNIENILNGLDLSTSDIYEQLKNITNLAINISGASNTPQFPQDIVELNHLVSDSLDILLEILPNETNNTDKVPFLSEVLDVIDNLLDNRYEESWKEVNLINGSELLMGNVEKYGRYAGQHTILNNQSEHQEVKKNINLEVNVPREIDIDFVFSSPNTTNVEDEGLVQLEITNQELKMILQTSTSGANSSKQVAVVNSLVKNIGDFLIATTKENEDAGTDVVSTQVILNRVSQTNINVQFNFTTKQFKYNTSSPRCAFWNYTGTGNDSDGQWSEDGIETVDISFIASPENYQQIVQYTIVCNATHLTPFFVLVDAHGIFNETTSEGVGLSYLSYIGISLSCICLILTIIVLITLKKELIKSVQFFIHFNLSIALLIGYLIYLFFIDDKIIPNLTYANNGTVCAFVAGMLHYFFLAAFSWMLCEGIMLFLLLVVVFSTISKRWYVFLIIGWGLPVLPVVISAGAIPDAYGVPGKFCWLNSNHPEKKGAVWAFLGPMILIILINIGFLILAVRALAKYHSKTLKLKSKDDKKVGVAVFKKSIIGAVTLIPLLGLTWLIGVFSVDSNSTVFAWLFVVLTTTQGIMIFSINILRNDKIRQRLVSIFHVVFNKHKKVVTTSYKPKPSIKRHPSTAGMTLSDSSNQFGIATNPYAAFENNPYPTLDKKRVQKGLDRNRESIIVGSINEAFELDEDKTDDV